MQSFLGITYEYVMWIRRQKTYRRERKTHSFVLNTLWNMEKTFDQTSKCFDNNTSWSYTLEVKKPQCSSKFWYQNFNKVDYTKETNNIMDSKEFNSMSLGSPTCISRRLNERQIFQTRTLQDFIVLKHLEWHKFQLCCDNMKYKLQEKCAISFVTFAADAIKRTHCDPS